MKKKFFLRLLVFILLFFPLNHLLMRAYVRFTRQPYVYEYTRKTFESLKDEVSLLVAGDSHALNAFNDTLVPDAYNYATRGESPVHTYYKLRTALAQPDFRPRVVVLPVDLHTFSSFRSERLDDQDPAFWSQYVDYLEVGREQGYMIPMMLDRAKAEFAYLGGLDEALTIFFPTEPWEVAEMQKGYAPDHVDFSTWTEERQLDQAEERIAKHLQGSQMIDPLMVTYTNRLLDLLEERDIQVVLVWYPVTDLYTGLAADLVSVDDHFSAIQALFADRENVLWLDYHDLFWGHPEYFSDSDHLNVDGAQVFTEQFIHDLEASGVSW